MTFNLKMSVAIPTMVLIAQLSLAENLFPCLPPERKLSDIVSAEMTGRDASGRYSVKTTIIKDRLIQLKAHCKNGKLVDGKSRQIYFYQLTGCWGAPPTDYREIMQKQRREIENLKKSYTVIELTCNPKGLPVP